MKRTCLLLSLALLLGACTTQVVENIPLPEHPRPDFERPQWENLNGYWNFGFEENNLDQRILVPFPWGSPLSEVKTRATLPGTAVKSPFPVPGRVSACSWW